MFDYTHKQVRMDDPKEIVREGYDHLKDAYRVYYEQGNSSRYHAWLTELTMHLPAGGNVLELGCADGIPTAQFLSEQFDYFGVDISPVQVALAQRNVPAAVFTVADMASLAFPDASFNGVIALYSIIHLPLQEQLPLF